MKNILILVGISLLFTACGGNPTPAVSGERSLQVVTTTNILADVVRNVGGENVSVEAIVPEGIDPHEFEPAPQDIVRLSEADLVFQNGLGYEASLASFLESARSGARIISVSDSIPARQFTPEEADIAGEGDHEVDSRVDPHVWLDPNNVSAWTGTIAAALGEADPDHADEYRSRAQSYQQALADLDSWIQEQVAQVPEANRLIVADHLVFGYFADRYGFRQVGSLAPGFSSMAEPSAQELAALQDTISSLGVKAVFVGSTVNPSLANQIAEDTGAKLVHLYTESLSDSSGKAATYLDYMRYNVSAIVGALK